MKRGGHLAKENTRLKDTFITYDGKPPKKSNRRFLIIIFILLVLSLVIFSFVYNLYTSTRNAYESNIYQVNNLQMEEVLPDALADRDYINHLLVALDYREIDGQQFEDASWVVFWQINKKDKSYQQLFMPADLELIEAFNGLYVNNYIEHGIGSLVENFATALNMPIDYVTTIRLGELRPIVENLGHTDIYISHDIELEESLYRANQSYQMTGRQFEKLLYANSLFPSEDKNLRQFNLFTQLFEDVFSFNNLLAIDDIFKEAYFGIQSNLPYHQLLNFLIRDYESEASWQLINEINYQEVDESYKSTYQINRQEWEDFIQNNFTSQ